MSEERETLTEDKYLMETYYTTFGDYLSKNIFDKNENMK